MSILNKTKDVDNSSLFSEMMVNKKVLIDFRNVKSNMKTRLTKYLNHNYTNKCHEEGYVMKDSVKIINYSAGQCKADKIEYVVVFIVNVCNVYEDMKISCVVDNVTKAGLKCSVHAYNMASEDITYDNSPLTIFCARDHHYNHDTFHEVKHDENIVVRVLGSRYELHDKFISVIAIMM